MYSVCLSCHSDLGRNDILESLPVGRRFAFDPAKGRVWILCTTCRVWNLVPVDERWEAVEAAERLFETAMVGASTENVSLARTRNGIELVRIGCVQRPEFAAWRYGRRLLSRWRRHKRELWVAIGAGAAAGAVPFLGTGVLWGTVAAYLGWAGTRELVVRSQVVATTPSGQPVRQGDAHRALLRTTEGCPGWYLEVPRKRCDPVIIEGEVALRVLRTFLPRVNTLGGPTDQVDNAVEEVVRLGSPERVLRESAVELQYPQNMDRRYRLSGRRPSRIATGHPVIKLAMEMAVNEETERGALEGELDVLKREWQEAEELAAIADDLLLPESLRRHLRALQERARGSG